jgi:hypothetical protein
MRKVPSLTARPACAKFYTDGDIGVAGLKPGPPTARTGRIYTGADVLGFNLAGTADGR